MKNERAIVYIDGFNLYFGLRAATVKSKNTKRLPKRAYWLDVQSLAERLVQDRQLVCVKYFTARIKGNPKKQSRQNVFLSAIQHYCSKLQIFEGRYLLREMLCTKCRHITQDMICPKCGHANNLPEEKKSDVNIATQMLKDAFENRFDTAYLVSGDSDLVPPIEVIRSMIPPKKIIVAFPPHRGGSTELKNATDVHVYIANNTLKQSMLPREIVKLDGSKLIIPIEWDQD